jgi:predicted nucleotidyltransferase
MTLTDFCADKRLVTELAEQPYPLIFASLSGAHLYGFPSPDSDYDLRGVHILPARQVVGLITGPATIELSKIREGLEVDLVTHDVEKFFQMLLKKNGYVLEQLYSPLVIHSSPVHGELKEIARGCITRHHAHHYMGFAQTEWKLFEKDTPHRVKPLLYVFRVLLTGIHLMRSGLVQANLTVLNEEFHFPWISDLIAIKRQGPERAFLEGPDIAIYRREFERLMAELESAYDGSSLPDVATAKAALNDLLIAIRLDR